jgi:LysR family transcriptional regulator, hydrogen peroxide-inducible genes activator
LLLAPGNCFREQVLDAIPHLRAHLTGTGRTLIEGSTLSAIAHMVASGLGVTVVPLAAAQGSWYGEDILAVRPFLQPPTRTLVLAWRATFPRHQALDVLRQAVLASSVAYWKYSTGSEQSPPGLLVVNKDW